MFIVQLLTTYQPKDASGNAQTSLNAGEFCGFSRKEYDFIIEKKLGLPAKAVRMLKTIDRKDTKAILGKSWEGRKTVRPGQALTVLASVADRLIKEGLAEELVLASTVASHKDQKGTIRDSGTFACSPKEMAEHVKNQTAEPYVHPMDEIAEEDEELRMMERSAQTRVGAR
jgi:hypothetical protein